MNDEVRQIREETFDYIILGGIGLSLVAGLAILIIEGPASAWFVRVMALLLIMGIAWVVRFIGKPALAVYVLVVQLVGLVAETFLHTSTITTFVPYLLIPIMLIASFFFTPLGALIAVTLSILSLLAIAGLVHQFAWLNLISLLPAFVLSLLATLLGIKLNHGITILSERLLESRSSLKARTLEIMAVQKRLDELQQKANRLEQRLQRAKLEISQAQQQKLQTHHQVYGFTQELTQELKASLKKLERAIIEVEKLPEAETYPAVVAGLWERVDHLRSLAINLEEIAQVEHGPLELNYEEVDILSLIDEVIGVARGLAREKNLEIYRSSSQELPSLQADPTRLRQVLLHVLSNAVKYTDEGRIEVQAEADEQELTILVSDTGMGIGEEEVQQVFERFGRGSSPLSQARQGSGLGLAIDKQLIERHWGRMGLNSAPGQGTTLHLVLPLKPKEQVVPKEETPAAGLKRLNLTPEPDATTLSRPFAVPVPALNNGVEALMLRRAAASTSFGPIRRFGSLYARRFITLGLVLLAAIALPVVLLASLNRQVASSTSATPEAGVATTVSALIVTLEPTPTLPASPTSAPTASPTALPSPTLTALPAASPTPPPATSTPQPAPTQTSTPRPPATPTPLPPTSTLEPSPTPEPSPTSSPLPSPTAAATASLYQVVQVDEAELSFSSGQSGALLASRTGLSQEGADLNVVAENSRLAWSPEGQQLLFTGDEGGDRELYLINPANGQPLRLTAAPGDDLQADWSPDGRQIAFSSGRTGNLEIFVMNADGTGLIQLTDSYGFDEWPVWSPTGDQLAFVSDRDGNVELYVMDADGSNLRRLTNHPADDWPASWSPDGQRLVFASNREENWNLYIVAASGGPALPLTRVPGDEREPIWSPDGQAIAFSHDGSGNWDIYMLPAPASQVTVAAKDSWRQVTETERDERYPTWKP